MRSEEIKRLAVPGIGADEAVAKEAGEKRTEARMYFLEIYGGFYDHKER